jgi:hypothetical protein
MTKKRMGTKRKRVRKQMRRKSRKVRKSMRGGNRRFVESIIKCLKIDGRYPEDTIYYSDNFWNELTYYIHYKTDNHLIVIECNAKNVIPRKQAILYTKNITGNAISNIKGELYGIIGNSQPVRLWWNGRQQTYQPPSSNQAIINTEMSPQGIQSVRRRLFNEEDNPDDDNRVSPSYRAQ